MIDIYEVVKKLVGAIEPVGETHTDNRRYENLKVFTELVDRLVTDLHDIKYNYKNNHQFSMKRASEYASKFLNELDISE
jgi:uncharacterized protein YaaR (DUF327 family)